MKKICKKCGVAFEITDEDMQFYDKVSPIFGGRKFLIPAPNFCPDCRQQRRLSWQNIVHLYKRKSDLSGKEIISNFSPDKIYKVYDSAEWWDDKFDPLKYGRDFDFNKPFFEQFQGLMSEVPFPNLNRSINRDENSDYTNYALANKDCYLIFHANNSRDCCYGFGVKYCTDVLDVLNVFSSEILYECIDCEKCYDLFFSQDCENCTQSLFLHDCIGCKNCIACHNLRDSEYHIFNKKVSADEFSRVKKEILAGSYKIVNEWKNKFKEFLLTLPHRALFEKQNEECSGDHVCRCKNVGQSFDIKDTRDAKFCDRVFNGPNYDCYDINQFGMRIEKCYECSIVGVNGSNVLFGMICRDQIYNLIYCLYCHSCNNSFGCMGLKKNEYCILNKQYTKEQYAELVPKIIEHMRETEEWGEFFPAEISLFGYNETIADEYYPLTKDQALEKGFKWSDYVSPQPHSDKVFDKEQMKMFPDNIREVSDDVLNWALTCEESGKMYKISKKELNFYREHGLPIPRRCSDQRHLDRLRLKNPKKLWERKCLKCGMTIQSVYSPDRPEMIYCEKCYLD